MPDVLGVMVTGWIMAMLVILGSAFKMYLYDWLYRRRLYDEIPESRAFEEIATLANRSREAWFECVKAQIDLLEVQKIAQRRIIDGSVPPGRKCDELYDEIANALFGMPYEGIRGLAQVKWEEAQIVNSRANDAHEVARKVIAYRNRWCERTKNPAVPNEEAK